MRLSTRPNVSFIRLILSCVLALDGVICIGMVILLSRSLSVVIRDVAAVSCVRGCRSCLMMACVVRQVTMTVRTASSVVEVRTDITSDASRVAGRLAMTMPLCLPARIRMWQLFSLLRAVPNGLWADGNVLSRVDSALGIARWLWLTRIAFLQFP